MLELEGLYAMPGMVDAHCHIGMWEDGNMIEGDDGNETSGPLPRSCGPSMPSTPLTDALQKPVRPG